VLQYMAAGLPVITDAAGVNQHIVADGETGFVVKNQDEWCSAILALAADETLRRRMGNKGRERLISEQFTLEHQSKKIILSLSDNA